MASCSRKLSRAQGVLTPTTVGRAGQGHGWDETAPARPGTLYHPWAETMPLACGGGRCESSPGWWWAGRGGPQVPPLSPASLLPAGFRDFYTKVLEEEAASVSSADTGQALASAWGWGWGRDPWPCLHLPCHPPSLSPGLCSEVCLSRLARCPAPKLLRARSAEKRRPVPTFQKVPLPSGPAPAHSLGDLKGGWPGRGLVTRFLQMSKKAPDPSGSGAHGHKQVGIGVGGLGRYPGKPGASGWTTWTPAAVCCRYPGARGAGLAGRASTFEAAAI